jgi:hypothetical protein
MPNSRRSTIINLSRKAKTGNEILAELNREFPPGTFKTSNENALSGVKREFGNKARAPEKVFIKSQRMDEKSPLKRDELIRILRSFDAEPVIREYQRHWMGMTPRQILAGSADKTIFRAFRTIRQVGQEAPSAVTCDGDGIVIRNYCLGGLRRCEARRNSIVSHTALEIHWLKTGASGMKLVNRQG